MPNINKYRIAVIILAVVVVALVIVLFVQSGGNVPTAQNLDQQLASTTAQATAPTNTAAQGGAGAPNAPAPAPGATPPAATGFVIHLRTPIAGETWTIGQQNIVSWDRAAGVSGQIELLDASTKSLVGVIIPQLGPNQTSYTWNTRDILLSRTNPLKKTVLPGTYLIRLAFDGNNLSPVTSGAFTITQ